MITKLHCAFPICIPNACIATETSELFYILDDEATKKCYISKEKKYYPYFTIENPLKRKIHFLAIDACVFCDNAQQRCDFAIFDSSEFHFVELKSGASNATKSDKKKKAIEQLKHTITTFKEKVNFDSHKIKAHICVGFFSPSPSAKSSDLPNMLYFMKKYNALLLEGNHIRV